MDNDRRGWRPGVAPLSRTSAIFVVLLLATTTQRASGTCTTINQVQRDSLSTSLTNATISCLPNYQLRIITVTVNQLPITPSSITNSTCQQADQTTNVLNQCPTNNTSVSNCTFRPTLSGSNSSSCSESFLVTTTYRCMPVYRVDPRQSTGSSVSVGSNATVLNSGISIGSLTSPFDTTNYFSIYIPADLELILSVVVFVFTGTPSSSSCSSRVAFFDINNQTVAQFCNSSSSTVNLGCGNGTPRFFRVQYVTNSPAVGVIYAITLTVPQTGKIMAQGGTPSFPLFAADSITTTSVQPLSTASRTTADGQVTTATSTSRRTTSSVATTASVPTTGAAAVTSRSNPPTTAARATSGASSAKTTTGSMISTSAVTTGGPAVSTTAAAVVATSVPIARTTAGQVTTAASVETATNFVGTTASPVQTSGGPAVAVTTAAEITSITTGSSVTASTAQAVAGFGGISQSAVAGIAVGSFIAGSILIISTIIGAYYGCTPSAPLPNTAVSQATVQIPQYPARPLPTTINYQLDPRSYNTGPFRNVTEFYVDGNKSSTLVLDRRQEPQMYKTVIRV